jgi:hypothetical protein
VRDSRSLRIEVRISVSSGCGSCEGEEVVGIVGCCGGVFVTTLGDGDGDGDGA